jgi:hypothetical protein
MAFPTTPLPVVAGIAFGANPVNPTSWNFSDVTTDFRESSAINIQVGRRDENSLVSPTGLGATIDNRTGNYCRTNPLSIWYGVLDKGTPVSAAVTRIADTFTRSGSGLGTDADSGLVWTATGAGFSTNGSAALAALASANLFVSAVVPDAGGHDVDVTHISSISAVTTGAAWVDATIVRWSDNNNFYRVHTEFSTDGTIGCKIAKVLGGSSTDLTSLVSTGVSYSAGTVIKTRVRAIGARLQVRAWLNSGNEPSTWTCEVDDDDLTGTGPGLYEWRVAGNSNAGTLTCTIDNYRVDVIRAITPVPEWPVRWDQTGRDVTAPITGAGPLRRLSQGSPGLRSPIFRQLSAQNPMGYWPLEDASGAASAASGIARGTPATVTDGSFGSTDCPPGASSALTLATGGVSRVAGKFTAWSVPLDGYAVMAYFRLPTLPASGSPVVTQKIFEIPANGSVTRWIIYATSTGFYVEGYQPDGTLLVNTGSFTYGIDPTKWFALQLEAQEVGGNVNWALIWHQVGSTAFSSGSGSFAGTADRVTAATAWAPVDGTLVSHLWFGDDLLPFVDSTFQLVSAGYAGERAGNRLIRLAAEEGVPLALIGDPSKTAMMGVQHTDTLLNLLRECEAADQGVLHERGAGLAYLCYRSMLSQSVAWALDFDAGHIAAPPEPTDDDQRLINEVVLTRAGGSSVTLTDPASITKNGTYTDESTVNLYSDDQLSDHAGWRLNLGTIDELRWPRIELQLHRNPSLIKDWLKVRVGSRITVANPPDQVGTDGLDLIVEGWTETLGIWTWDVELVCSPASVWTAGKYDDSSYRYDSRTTTLLAGMNTGDLLASLVTVDRLEFWSYTSAPYDVMISGQKNRVLGMSQPDSVAVVDGTFETGNTGAWAVTGGSLAASTAQVHRGTYSALLTVSGSPANALIRDHTTVAVSPGQTFTAKMWVRCSASRNVLAVIDYYNGVSYLSSSTTTVAVTANTWTELTVSGTAPASTTRIEYGPTMDSSPANGTLLYVDDVDILRTDVQSGRQLATLQRGINTITKSLPVNAEVHVANPGRYAISI